MAIVRTPLIDDDGSGYTGTILNNAWQTGLYNAIDGAFGALQTYTPAWTAAPTAPAIGNGTITGQFFTVGKIVYVRILITAGSTTTFGSGGWLLTLPMPVGGPCVLAMGTALIAGSAYALAGAFLTVATQINPFAGPIGSLGVSLDATHPAAWGPTSWLDYHVLYTTP